MFVAYKSTQKTKHIHMKQLTLLLLIISISGITYAQELVRTSDVPTSISRRFEQKNRSATKVKWYRNPNKSYIAEFVDNGNQTSVTINQEGKVVKKIVAIKLKELNNKISTDLRKNHKDLDAISATLIEEGRKNKYYSIVLHKDQGRKKEPLVYEIQYDLQGKFITMYEPEIEDDTEEYKSDDYANELDEDLEDLEEIEYNVDIKKSGLPGPAGAYLKKRFDLDYHYPTIRLNKNMRYGPHYFVEARKIGEGVTHQFWFDTDGKLLREKDVID